MYSCADNEIATGGSSTENISFDACINGISQSRSCNDKDIPTRSTTVKRIEGCDTLFLHTIVSTCGMEISQATSRAKPMENMHEYGSFGVFAYVYKGTWEEANVSSRSKYMDNTKVTEHNNYWSPETEYRWPLAENNIRFFAYAPYNVSGIILPGEEAAGTPVIRYSVPTDVAKQRDVVATCTEGIKGGADHQPVYMNFKHILTSIKFVAGDAMLPGTITRISLIGVHGSGSYTFETDSWDLDDTAVDFTYRLNKKMDGSPDAEITSSEATFMMLPQTLPEDAIIEVEFADHLSNVKQREFDINSQNNVS